MPKAEAVRVRRTPVSLSREQLQQIDAAVTVATTDIEARKIAQRIMQPEEWLKVVLVHIWVPPSACSTFNIQHPKAKGEHSNSQETATPDSA